MKKNKKKRHEGRNGKDTGPKINDVIVRRLLKGDKDRPVSRESLKKTLRNTFPEMGEYYVGKYVSDALSWHIDKRKKLGMTVKVCGEDNDKFYLERKVTLKKKIRKEKARAVVQQGS